MTNAERFRNPDERFEEFRKFCKDRNCENCPCQGLVSGSTKKCTFEWLELEYREELKPCPLCGHADVRVLKNSAGDVWYISCNGCGCRTGGNVVKDMAFEAWNRRV